MKEIIIKDNNIITKYEPTNNEKDNFFSLTDEIELEEEIEEKTEKELEHDHLSYIDKDIRYLINKVSFMTNTIIRNKDLNTEFKNLFNNIQDSKDENDLLKISINFITLYKKTNKYVENTNRYLSLLSKKEKLTVSITTRGIIEKYFFDILDNLDGRYSNEKITELEQLKITGVSINDLMKLVNIEIKDNITFPGMQNLIERTFSDVIDNIYCKKADHLCFKCQNGYPDKCEKISDEKKKPLEEYSFIESGCRINNNGKLKKLIILKCKNFKPESNNH